MSESLVPSAKDYAMKLALIEVEEAEKEALMKRQAEQDVKALMDQLSEPSGVSDEVAIQRAITMIERAVSNRKTEVRVYRFPNRLCTDGGRAINQQERGWEETLTGVPKEVYLLWFRHFRDQGYKLRVEIIDFPDGMPGDVAMTLMWM